MVLLLPSFLPPNAQIRTHRTMDAITVRSIAEVFVLTQKLRDLREFTTETISHRSRADSSPRFHCTQHFICRGSVVFVRLLEVHLHAALEDASLIECRRNLAKCRGGQSCGAS